jgi:hypothetical protein
MVAIKGKQYKLDFNKNKKLDREDFDILNKIKKRKKVGGSRKTKISKDTKAMPNPLKDKQKKYKKPIKIR